MNLSVLGASCKWNHTIFALLCLAYFTKHVFKIHLYYCHVSKFHSFLWLKNILLYVCITFGLSIHLLIDTGCYHLLAIVNNSAMKFGVQVSVWVPTFSYFGCIPRGGISGLYSVSMFNLVRNHKLFSTGAARHGNDRAQGLTRGWKDKRPWWAPCPFPSHFPPAPLTLQPRV